MIDYYVCDVAAISLINKRWFPVAILFNHRYLGLRWWIIAGHHGDEYDMALIENLTSEELVILTLACKCLIKVTTDNLSKYLENCINTGELNWRINDTK